MAATWFIWGSTYLGVVIAVRDLPPFLTSGLRNVMAGTLIYGFLRLRGARRPTGAQWRTALVVGVCLLALGNGAVTWAAQREPSGVIALVVSLVPLWLMVFGWMGARGVRPAAIEVAGIALGLLGIALLVVPRQRERGRTRRAPAEYARVGGGLGLRAHARAAAGAAPRHRHGDADGRDHDAARLRRQR
jgi:drug/metabolite transporter (DMT)-like permease